MATRRTISIEFNNVIAQAKELETCAEELDNAQRSLQAVMDNLNAGWKGEGASLYLQKCVRLKQKLAGSSGNLTRIAGTIRRTAQEYYDAEMQALELVRTDSGGGLH